VPFRPDRLYHWNVILLLAMDRLSLVIGVGRDSIVLLTAVTDYFTSTTVTSRIKAVRQIEIHEISVVYTITPDTAIVCALCVICFLIVPGELTSEKKF